MEIEEGMKVEVGKIGRGGDRYGRHKPCIKFWKTNKHAAARFFFSKLSSQQSHNK